MNTHRLGAWGSRLATCVFLVCAGATLAAQDRVLLHDSRAAQIREIEITDGGRTWATLRTVELPPPLGGVTLAPIADGSRLVGIVRDTAAGVSLLVQYDVATARAAVLDVGRFDLDAFVVADASAVRIFVVEPARARITFLDGRLRPESMALSEPTRISAALVTSGYLVLRRNTVDRTTDTELVVIDIERREAVRTWRLGSSGTLLVRRDVPQIYREYWRPDGGRWVKTLDLISLTTGEVLAQVPGVQWSYVFQMDEARGVIVHDQIDYIPTSTVPGQAIRARDAATLAVVGQMSTGLSERRVDWKLSQTSREAAILLFHRNPIGGYFGDRTCEGASPRIDIFDGRTFTLVNRIELQRSCPAIIPLPPR